VSLALLLYPRNAAGYPGGLSENGFAADVEPGEYLVCIQRPERRCGTAKIVPGGDVSSISNLPGLERSPDARIAALTLLSAPLDFRADRVQRPVRAEPVA